MSLFAVFGLLAALLALAFVLYPLLRPGPYAHGDSEAEELAERRRTIYQQILDVEFDQQLGKIDDADAYGLTDELLRQASALIAQESTTKRDADAEIEREIQAMRRALMSFKDDEPGLPSPSGSRQA